MVNTKILEDLENHARTLTNAYDIRKYMLDENLKLPEKERISPETLGVSIACLIAEFDKKKQAEELAKPIPSFEKEDLTRYKNIGEIAGAAARKSNVDEMIKFFETENSKLAQPFPKEELQILINTAAAEINKRNNKSRTGSNSAILCDNLSHSFLDKYKAVTLEDGDLRIYDEEQGIYQTCKNKYHANNLMIEIAGEMGLILSPAQITNALEIVKSKTPGTETSTPLNLIPVNNGVLNLDTMEVTQYSPELIFLSKFPVDYNPSAKAPEKFLRMLETTFEGVEEQIPLVQEMFGYCFLRSYFIQVAFFLVGNGGNGKGVLLNILSALLGGSQNVSYLSFKELSEPKNENMLYDLFGKHANICGDTGKCKIKETDTFKKVTGNDYIRARKLYKDSLNFKNFAKIILAFNKLPEVEDFSDGFKRRLQMIEFPNSFEGQTENKNLESEIIEGGELEGVFKWALEGLKRLMANNALSCNKSNAQKGLEYARKSKPMQFFVRKCVVFNFGGFVTKADITQAFTKFAKYYGLPQLTAQEFKKELIKECREIDIETREKRDQTNKFRPYGFTNIAIDEDVMKEVIEELEIRAGNKNSSPISFAQGPQGVFKIKVAKALE